MAAKKKAGAQLNKKIRNATPLEYDGIKFRSKLEVACYKELVSQGLNPLYEQKQVSLLERFSPRVPFLSYNHFKRKNRHITVVSPAAVIDSRPVDAWLYTPDFCIKKGNCIIYIEVKGLPNDVYPYKRKMFRFYLEELQKKDALHHYEFWEIHSGKQLKECIDYLKKQLNV